MMKNALMAVVLFILWGCASQEDSELIGVWQSNKLKTLQSMEAVSGIDPKAKALFEGDFFGLMIVEFRQGEWRTYFEDENLNAGGTAHFTPYQLIAETKEFFVLQELDESIGKTIETKLLREGDCYYLIIARWGFREYFCKIK